MISEPVTTLTDLILAAECFLLGHLLFWNDSRNMIRSWAMVYFFLGMAALMGAVAHGASYYMENIPFLLYSWPATLFSIITASVFLNIAFVEEFIFKNKKIYFFTIGVVASFFYLHLLGYLHVLNPKGDLNFLIAVASYLPSILLQLFFHFMSYLKKRNLSSALICNGILLTLLGSSVQVFKISLHTQFNHNDLYHVIQMLSLGVLFKGLRNK